MIVAANYKEIDSAGGELTLNENDSFVEDTAAWRANQRPHTGKETSTRRLESTILETRTSLAMSLTHFFLYFYYPKK